MSTKHSLANGSDKDVEKDGAMNGIDQIQQIDLPVIVPAQKHSALSRADHAQIIHDLAGATFTNCNTSSLPPGAQHDISLSPPGTLYASIIKHRTHLKYRYGFLSIFYNVALILQILFGATLTALSGNKAQHQVSLTILAAANTVNAGILALMHNSGLPERLKNDFGEFEKVEQHIRALIETGVVKEGWTKEEVVADCWDRYQKARATIGRNKPANYKGSTVERPVVLPTHG